MSDIVSPRYKYKKFLVKDGEEIKELSFEITCPNCKKLFDLEFELMPQTKNLRIMTAKCSHCEVRTDLFILGRLNKCK